jgi:predicted nucleic acid-binding protein
MAVLVNASTILALASIGELDLLKTLFKKVHITKEIRKEILIKDEPCKQVIRKALGKWILIKKPKSKKKPIQVPGLGLGERSLFSVYSDGDLLVIDDALARRTARAMGYEFTGLLGL